MKFICYIICSLRLYFIGWASAKRQSLSRRGGGREEEAEAAVRGAAPLPTIPGGGAGCGAGQGLVDPTHPTGDEHVELKNYVPCLPP
eukprot:scaffold47696_cov72-Phaeocystis_antarctica.AAC.3